MRDKMYSGDQNVIFTVGEHLKYVTSIKCIKINSKPPTIELL